jgi:hypothetical protein
MDVYLAGGSESKLKYKTIPYLKRPWHLSHRNEPQVIHVPVSLTVTYLWELNQDSRPQK